MQGLSSTAGSRGGSRRWRTLAALGVLVLSLGLAGTAEAGGERRVTADSAAWPWSALGRVNRDGSHCTGVLVGPAVAVTAGHCMYSKRLGRLAPASALHFVAGWRGGTYLAHARVLKYEMAPTFDPASKAIRDNAPSDWAVLYLDAPIGHRVGWVGIAELTPDDVAAMVRGGETLSQAGYSGDHRHLLTVDAGCRLTGVSGDRAVFLHDCQATRGDSGSPLLRAVGGRYEVLALHSASNRREIGLTGLAVPSATFLAAVRAALGLADGAPVLGGPPD